MIEVVSTGMQTSFQDLGRFGYRKQGIPLSGAMDQYAAILANQLLGNVLSSTLLEFTVTGPVLKFLETTEIAITGAGFSPAVSGVDIPLNKRILIEEGSVLSFGLAAHGVRGYLAVSGGFKIEKFLGSSSYHATVTPALKIEKGLVIETNFNRRTASKNNASVHINNDYIYSNVIEAYKGPDYELLSEKDKATILSTKLTIAGTSNRMAYILDSSEEISGKEIITAPVQPGTVQLIPSGRLIVLMRDAQTTGGYARILQLTEQSINILAQKRANERVKIILKD